MNDELEALLRDHYRAAADHVTAGPGTVRRFQDAGRAARLPERARWRWAFPALAAVVTAAVLVTVALFLWPGGGRPAKPHPMAPPASPSAPAATPPTATPPGRPSVSPTRVPEPGVPPQGRSSAEPTPRPTGTRAPRTIPPTHGGTTPYPSSSPMGPGAKQPRTAPTPTGGNYAN
ncbi:MAG TPA: hypothetical protein VFV01_16510 [Spirillospora sp.]|nr:hypothetical protein [Spirillospora sp.]